MARTLTPASLLVAGGVFGGAALSFEAAWPFIFLSLVPAYALVYQDGISVRRRFVLGYLHGISLIGTTLYWVWNTYPLDWAGISEKIPSLIGVAGVWVACTLFLGVFVALWTLAAHAIARKTVVDALSLPLLWVAFEYARAWGFTVFAWGPGSVFEPYFSFGFLGYALSADASLLHLARAGGVYALSYTVALISFALFAFLARRPTMPRMYAGIALLAVAAATLLVPPYVRSRSPLAIATMRTDIPSRLVSTEADQQERLLQVDRRLRALAPDTEVVLIPEGVRFLDTLRRHGVDPREYLVSIFGERDVLLIDTRRAERGGTVREEIVFYSTQEGEMAVREKRVLTPIGEYPPYLWSWTMRVFGMDIEVQRIEHFRAYLPGVKDDPVQWRGVSLPTLLCSEIIAPGGYRSLAGVEKNTVLINLSSQALFHGGRNPFAQLSAMARVHAAWNDSPFFQSTNGADAVRFAR